VDNDDGVGERAEDEEDNEGVEVGTRRGSSFRRRLPKEFEVLRKAFRVKAVFIF